MQRLIRYCAGWVMATTLATGVSWVAIQNLVTTAALSQPSSPYVATALTVTRPTATPTAPRATASRTARPSARPTRSRATAPATAPAVSATTRAARPAQPSSSAATPTSEADVQGYAMKGGQVVLELRPDSAALVSAVPAAGFTTETWKTDYWIRIDFANGDQRSSIIVNWYEHPPVVDQTEF